MTLHTVSLAFSRINVELKVAQLTRRFSYLIDTPFLQWMK